MKQAWIYFIWPHYQAKSSVNLSLKKAFLTWTWSLKIYVFVFPGFLLRLLRLCINICYTRKCCNINKYFSRRPPIIGCFLAPSRSRGWYAPSRWCGAHNSMSEMLSHIGAIIRTSRPQDKTNFGFCTASKVNVYFKNDHFRLFIAIKSYGIEQLYPHDVLSRLLYML